jgi:ABC-type multidrug transport system ATPase subunit
VALTAAPAVAGSVQSQEWWLQTLQVTRAWHSTHGRGVTVAVLDTGVDPRQPDLAGSVVTGPDYTGSGRRPGGPFWGMRGTAVASLIAGHGHGSGGKAGIVGVAPAATILSVRVTLEPSDPRLGDAKIAAALPGAIAQGIMYAVSHHAAVIDLPLDPVTTPGAPGAGGSAAEKAAVDYALAHNVLLVAPAGDDMTGSGAVNYPAAYLGVISVGAVDSAFTRAYYSSSQPYVTLTATGDGLIAATMPSGYAQMSSTAAASAMVAGAAALVRARYPALNPSQVTSALMQSATHPPPAGKHDGAGAGTVDAAAALATAESMAPPAPTPGPAAAQSSNVFTGAPFATGVVVLIIAVTVLGLTFSRRRGHLRAAPAGASTSPPAAPPNGGSPGGTAAFGELAPFPGPAALGELAPFPGPAALGRPDGAPRQDSPPPPPAIALIGVGKVHRPRRAWWWPLKRLGSPVVAVEQLSFAVPEGKVFGLLGPNGSGKSTTVNLINGLAPPTAGQVRIFGMDPRRDRRQVLSRLGTVPQETALLGELTARANLEFHAGLYTHGLSRQERAARIDRALDLADLANRQHHKVKTFSGGMKRRLAIARQMLHDPDLLILDEPTLGVDPQNCLSIWQAIRDLAAAGKTILVTTNNLAEAERLCDQIAIIDNPKKRHGEGSLVTIGTPDELRQAHGETVVSLQLRGPTAAIGQALEGLRQLDGVSGVTSEPDPLLDDTCMVTVTTHGANPAAAIANAVSGHGELAGLSVHEPQLDEAFFRLTGVAARD